MLWEQVVGALGCCPAALPGCSPRLLRCRLGVRSTPQGARNGRRLATVPVGVLLLLSLALPCQPMAPQPLHHLPRLQFNSVRLTNRKPVREGRLLGTVAGPEAHGSGHAGQVGRAGALHPEAPCEERDFDLEPYARCYDETSGKRVNYRIIRQVLHKEELAIAAVCVHRASASRCADQASGDHEAAGAS